MTPTHSVRWIEVSLRAARPQWIVLSGYSMAPALLDGDRLRVEPLLAGCVPAIGDVTVVCRGGRLVVHRVVAHRDGHTITRGDACRCDDPPVDSAEILGRVVKVERARLRRLGRRILRVVGWKWPET
jgi:signal peptidase I